ncbi:MAG: hypothetical protein KC457_16675 [Myxococcales bacterium]|nr:hypothetical protein [Myxococcales bacterium]
MPTLTKTLNKLGPLVVALILPSLLTGCPGKEGEDDDIGDTGDETAESGTDTGDATESGTDQGTDTAGGTDTSDSTDGTDTANSTDTGDTTDTGEVDPEIEALCVEACGVLDMCQQGDPECVESCVDYTSSFLGDAECLDAGKALISCVAGLDCAGLDAYMEGNSPYPCEEEEANTCDPGNDCIVGVGQGENGDCNMSIECVDEPVYSVDCTADGCICFEDNVEIATCQLQEQICSEFDSNLIYDCCFG